MWSVDSATVVSIQDADRRTLEHWVRSPTSPQRLVLRSRMLLLAFDGVSWRQIAAQCGVSVATVKLWITRAQRDGVKTLQHDAPGRGRHSALDAAFRDRLREANLLDGSGEPISLRRAAAFLGVSA